MESVGENLYLGIGKAPTGNWRPKANPYHLSEKDRCLFPSPCLSVDLFFTLAAAYCWFSVSLEPITFKLESSANVMLKNKYIVSQSNIIFFTIKKPQKKNHMLLPVINNPLFIRNYEPRIPNGNIL
ncbi:MAG: hypothetical protein AB1633_11830, partial [Elusimicrobiota bacterium]